ncbi:MAG: two-component regulator propeller domain-containing protein [Saprospiraceae bacterium]
MKLNYYFLGILMLVCMVTSAQSNMAFNHLSIYDGLSQATVNTILQDKNNVIWLGTRDGLNQYDGYNFKVYKYDLRNIESVSNNNIKIVYEDKVGDLWIGTDKGLNRFNKKTETFERFFAQKDNYNALSDNNIRDIREDATGNLWIGTSEGGVCRVVFDGNKSQRKVKKFESYKSSKKINSLSDNSVRKFFLDETGNFWIGTDGGLNLLNSHNGTFSFKRITDTNLDFSVISVSCITEDKRGNLWMGTWGDGLIRMSNGTSQQVFKQYLPGKEYNFKEPYIVALSTDDKGRIWVGTWTNGLNVIEQDNRGQTIFTHYQHDPLNPKSICHNSIRSIFQDKSGVIWIGSYGNGISKYDKNATKFQHFEQDIHNSNGLKGEDVYAISEDNYGYVWIGTWVGGLHRTRDLNSGNYQHFSQSQFSNFTNEKITNLLLDNKGRFWIGTWGKGVYQANFTLNGAVNSFTTIDILNEDGEVSSGFNNIRQIYEGRDGTIWLATSKGVYRLKNNQFEYIQLFRNKENPESLGNDDIHSIFEDSRGNLWLGSTWNGLGFIPVDEIQTDKKNFVTTFKHQQNNLLSISSDNISVIYEDNKQNLWIGTEGAGINLYSYKNQNFDNFTESDGLPNGVINGILEDERGHLWLSTNNGISKFDTDKRIFENYDVRDGLQSNEFIRLSSYKTALGWMYFGGINGINYFHPAKIKSNQLPPKLIFTDFKIFNKSVDFTNDNAEITTPIQFVKEINLSYKDEVFSFEFAALNYTNPERNQYKYRLVGFNKIWQNIGNQRNVTFTNLNPGTYTLKVKGANSDGIWNDQPVSITINILPPFWATWWFRTIATILLGLTIFAFFRYRMRQVKVENEKLERLVQERTIKIQRQKELIEERSKFKEQFFSNVSHELRTPLNGILGISHLLAKTELNKTQRQFTQAIKTSADNLLVIINDLLDVSKLNAGQLELVQKPFDTITLFTTLYELFRPRIEEKGLKLNFDIDREIPQYLSGDQVRFYQILINLLGNALKFTAQGQITLRLRKDERENDKQFWIKIEVEDTGIGIPKDKIDKIFGNYTQVIDASGYHYEGSGLGLTIVKNLVEIKGGTINVQSEQYQGTTFTLFLPFIEPTDEAVDEFLLEEANQIFKQKWEGRKVLLIEDNKVNQLYAKNLFIEWQLNADFAMTIKEAEELTTHNDYDCILADVKLPDGDGLKFIRSIRESQVHLNHNTTVIVLTAGASPQERARATGLDIFAYMTKPFDPDSLMRALNLVFTQNIDKKIESKEIDYKYLTNLFQLVKNNKQSVVDLLEVYLKQAPKFKENIQKHIKDRDYENLYFETHTMLSSLRTIGIDELTTIMQNLNQSTRQLTSFEIIEEIYGDFERKHDIHLIKLKGEVKKIKKEIKLTVDG